MSAPPEQSPNQSYDFALIIPAWNEEAFIESSVAAAKAAIESVSANGQLIVVDNNSSDNTAQLAAAAGAEVVFEAENQISRARNAGANVANAGMYVFVDADSHISATLLQRALTLLESGDVVGGGAYVRPDREVNWYLSLIMSMWNQISRLFRVAAGCFVFVRSDAFVAVGGFSEKRYAGEELVLSRALRKWGKARDMRFHIIREHSMTTSMRKADWYSMGQLFRQFLVILLPGSLNSKRFMKTWYDDSTKRTRND